MAIGKPQTPDIAGILSASGVTSAQVFSAADFSAAIEVNTCLPVIIYGIARMEETAGKLSEFFDCGDDVTVFNGGKSIQTKLSGLAAPEGAVPGVCVVLKPRPLTEKKSFGFSDLKEILRVLRGPDGCPWDRAQTHGSIRANTIEEAYELAEAIDKSDYENMCEEVGDCMLQAFFHTEIAREAGEFDYKDVLNRLCGKLISRHTHIFGFDRAHEAEQALEVWERNKAAEKKSGTAHGVPEAMPALMRAFKIQKKASKAGFDWKNIGGALDKVREEFAELGAEIASGGKAAAEEEAGDLLFSLVNVLRFLDIEPETALSKANCKFIRRFEFIERKLGEKGRTPAQSDLTEMDALWEQAKSEGL